VNIEPFHRVMRSLRAKMRACRVLVGDC